MKKFAFILLLANASASINVGGEALYLKPCTAAFNYAVSDVVPRQDANLVSPNYMWGYRIFGEAEYCKNSIGVFYTSFDNTSTGSRRRDLFIPLLLTGTLFDNALARIKFHYRTVETRANLFLYQGYWVRFKLTVGGDYLHFRRTRQIFGNQAQSRFDEVFHFDGGGPTVGIQIDSCNLGGFRCHSLFTVTAFIGKQRMRTILDQTVILKRPKHTTCFPALYLKMGASYTLPLGCVDIRGEIGYEIHHYFQLIDDASLGFTTAGNGFNQAKENFGLWGPYMRIEVGF